MQKNDKVLLIELDHFKQKRHEIINVEHLLPFPSNEYSTILRNNFSIIVSALARSINGKKLKEIELEYLAYPEAQKLSNDIGQNSNVIFEDDEEDLRVDLVRIIDAYLYENGVLKITHPFLYNIKGVESQSTTVKNLSDFLKQTLFQEEELSDIFKPQFTPHVLLNLILTRLESLMVNDDTKMKNTYRDLLPEFTDIFIEDLKYLKQHEEYFMNNLELFLNYYIFTYAIQVLAILEKFGYGKSDSLYPFYYALEWEKVSKKRAAAHDLYGYRYVSKRLPNLFVHQQVLQQLSYNTFNEHQSIKELMSYSTLFQEVDRHGEVKSEQLAQDLRDWILKYSKSDIPNSEIQLPSTTDLEKLEKEGLVKELFKAVSKGMSKEPKDRYGKTIENLGVGVFLKQRGSLGYLFNMNHQLLMLLTAVIVKDKAKPFKEVIEGFEARGVKFDRHTVTVIKDLFNVQNILDNKSDSGDAQYVKPIL